MAENQNERLEELRNDAIMKVENKAQSAYVSVIDETKINALFEEKKALESINGKDYQIYQVELKGDRVGLDEETREPLTGRNTHVFNQVATKQEFDLLLNDISAQGNHSQTIERPFISGYGDNFLTSEDSTIKPDSYKVSTLDNGKTVIDYGAISLDRVDSKYTVTDAEKVTVVRQYLGLTQRANEASMSDSYNTSNELRTHGNRLLEQHNISKKDIDGLADSKRIEHKQKEKVEYSY